MAKIPTLAISIINYNSKSYLKKLLKNILSQKIKNLEIWVVDNASPDNGGKVVKQEFKKVHLIEAKENGGYAKGHNLALREIKSDYVLIINPDIEIPAGAIEEMLEFMEKKPQCGIASCQIVGFDNKLQSNGGDLPFGLPLLAWIFNLEMLPGLESLTGNFHRMDENYYQQIREVGWVGGTFMFIRSEVFNRIGFLPEDYFMYVEDVDFCFLAQNQGIKVMINPQVTIKHVSGASSKDPRFSQFKGEAQGLEIFYHKHFGQFSYVLIKLLLYFSVIARTLAFSVVGRSNIAKTYWKVLPYV